MNHDHCEQTESSKEEKESDEEERKRERGDRGQSKVRGVVLPPFQVVTKQEHIVLRGEEKTSRGEGDEADRLRNRVERFIDAFLNDERPICSGVCSEDMIIDTKVGRVDGAAVGRADVFGKDHLGLSRSISLRVKVIANTDHATRFISGIILVLARHDSEVQSGRIPEGSQDERVVEPVTQRNGRVLDPGARSILGGVVGNLSMDKTEQKEGEGDVHV